MTYSPIYAAPHSPTIIPPSPEALGASMFTLTTNATFNSSGVWPSANLAIYIPFTIRRVTQIYKLFTVNGSAAANSFDIGIYSGDGTKIISTGSTAQSGTTVVQAVTITTTTLGPGQYYMALAMNGTTGTFFKTGSAVQILHTEGILNQATAFPLPATATFATASQIYTPLFGLATTPNL